MGGISSGRANGRSPERQRADTIVHAVKTSLSVRHSGSRLPTHVKLCIVNGSFDGRQSIRELKSTTPDGGTKYATMNASFTGSDETIHYIVV